MNEEIKLPSPTIVTLPKPHMELSHFEGGDPYPVFNRNHMHDFAREFARAAVLADRAARPVADAGEIAGYMTRWVSVWEPEGAANREGPWEFMPRAWAEKEKVSVDNGIGFLPGQKEYRQLTYADRAAPSARTLSEADIKAMWRKTKRVPLPPEFIAELLAASRGLSESDVRIITRAARYLKENDCSGPAADLESLLAASAPAEAPSVRDAALEEAARACEALSNGLNEKRPGNGIAQNAALDCATYIRALQGKPEAPKAGYCERAGGCVCGGDLPRIREGCGNWIMPEAPKGEQA